jgi:hypothetical protein
MSLDAGLSARALGHLIEGSGRVIIAASRPDESAWELPGMRNGLFTNYLLGALRGEVARTDGSIWVSKVFSYVSRCVRRHGHQRPFQKAIGEDFVVLVQSKGKEQAKIKTCPALREIDRRSLRRVMHSAYNRAELSLLCRDLSLTLEDLPGTTLETQLMELIDHCHRHGLYDRLLERVQSDRPQLNPGL